MFGQLDCRRQGTGFSVLPISHSDLAAWQLNRGYRLAAWELDLLDKMEMERVGILFEKTSDKIGGKTPDRVVNTPMNMTLFDAMFGGNQ